MGCGQYRGLAYRVAHQPVHIVSETVCEIQRMSSAIRCFFESDFPGIKVPLKVKSSQRFFIIPCMLHDMVVDIAGFGLFGLLFGVIIGLSETSGTAKKGLGVLGGLLAAGGLFLSYQGEGSVGTILAPFSIGAILGLIIGAVLRQLKWLTIMFPFE